MSQADDMKAINDYMKRTPAITPEATALRNSWMTWYPSLGWYDLSFSQKVRDEASTRRNKFNLANAVTQAEKDNVVRVITTGMDTNMMQGKPRAPTLPTGEVGTQIPKKGAVTTAAFKGSHPTIKQGSTGPAVIEWQKFLGTVADGKFGPNTATLTRAFQTKKGLTADGVVGPQTWTAALGAPPVEAIAAAATEPPSLLESLNPFAPSVAEKKAIAAATIATAKKATTASKPTAKPAAKAAATPSTPSAPAVATKPAPSGGALASVKEQVTVAQAGMFGALDKLPLWAKVAGVAAAIGAIVLGRKAKTVDYSTGREIKRRRAA